MNVDTLKTLTVLLSSAKDYKPLVEVIVKVVKAYGPTLKDVIRDGSIGMIDIKADCVLHLEQKGFTREEAIIMVSDQWSLIKENLVNQSTRKSES